MALAEFESNPGAADEWQEANDPGLTFHAVATYREQKYGQQPKGNP